MGAGVVDELGAMDVSVIRGDARARVGMEMKGSAFMLKFFYCNDVWHE